MNWLFEHPWLILTAGILTELALSMVLARSSQRWIVWTMLGVLLATVGLVIVERLVVTDHEAVTATLDGAAAALERNDLNGVLSYISPSATDLRARAERSMKQFVISEARVFQNDLAIVIEPREPSIAKVRLTVRARGQARRATLPLELVLVKMTATLRKEAGRWLLVEAEYKEPR